MREWRRLGESNRVPLDRRVSGLSEVRGSHPGLEELAWYLESVAE